jgi:uncharacterized protein YjeT (DUF2065 family)
MNDLITAIGLVLVIEGVFYAGFPQAAKAFMRQALGMSDNAFRAAGFGGLVVGLAIVWLVRG